MTTQSPSALRGPLDSRVYMLEKALSREFSARKLPNTDPLLTFWRQESLLAGLVCHKFGSDQFDAVQVSC